MQAYSLGTSASLRRATIACRPRCPLLQGRPTHLVHTHRYACDTGEERRQASTDELAPWSRPDTDRASESSTPKELRLSTPTEGNGEEVSKLSHAQRDGKQNRPSHKPAFDFSRGLDSSTSVPKQLSSTELVQDYMTALQGYLINEDGAQVQRAGVIDNLRRLARDVLQPTDSRVLVEEADKIEQSLYPTTLDHPYWNYNIDVLYSYKGSGASPQEIWSHLVVDTWEASSARARRITERGERLSDYFLAWQSIPREERAESWPDIALWLLLNSPERALLFLRATNRSPGPSFKMVSECFWYIFVNHRELLEASPTSIARFYRYVSFCLGPSKWSLVAPSRRGLRLYVQTRKNEELVRTFEKFVQLRVAPSTRIWMDLLSAFIYIGDVTDALRAVEQIAQSDDWGRRRDDSSFLGLCIKLLRWDYIIDTEHGRLFRILNSLLAMGVRPNLPMYETIIRNAIGLNETQLAWDIFELMRSGAGFPKPTFSTYLMLLEDAVKRGDIETLERISTLIDLSSDFRREVHLVSARLQAIHKLSMGSQSTTLASRNAFSSMVALYDDTHDHKPLMDLGIIPKDYQSPPNSGETPPSAHSLGIMISGFLTQASEKPGLIRETFHQFQRLVLEGHKYIAPLAETDHVYNAFLYSMMPHIRLLNDCIEVVETMQKPFPHPVVVHDQPPRSIQKTGPTIRTWTILLQIFLRHQQPSSALSIRNLMLKQGQEFNDVTYKVVLKGLTHMQMVDEAAALFHLMANGPYTPDTHVWIIVDKIHNKERFHKVLRMLGKQDPPSTEASARERARTVQPLKTLRTPPLD